MKQNYETYIMKTIYVWFYVASRGPGDTQFGNGVRHFFTFLLSVEYKDIKQGLKTSEAFRDQVGNKNV